MHVKNNRGRSTSAIMARFERCSGVSRELSPQRAEPPSKVAGIALALSGGGFRATLFHLGVVERLYELGVLDQVAYLSTVSGGSILGATLALNWEALRTAPPETRAAVFDDRMVRPILGLVQADLRNRALRRCFRPSRLLSQRGNVLAEVLDELHFQGKTLGDLPRLDNGGPRVAINATNLRTAKRFRFSQDSIGDYKCYSETDVARLPVSTAVAASAAYPPTFAPLVLPFLGPYHAWTFASPPERVEAKGPPAREVALVDGGVYENLGLSAARQRADRIIAVDAGAPIDLEERTAESISATSLRAVDVMMSRILSSDVRIFVRDLEDGKLNGCFIRASRSAHEVATLPTRRVAALTGDVAGLGEPDARAVSLLRTDLDAFSDLEVTLLRYHGRSLADVAVQRFVPTWICSAAVPMIAPPPIDARDRKALRLGADRKVSTVFNLWSGS
jgi:NTE family protein